MTQKRPVCGAIKVRAYAVFSRAVEEGTAHGWRRAHKYTEQPDEATIKEQIATGVLNEVCEYFNFDDEADAPP